MQFRVLGRVRVSVPGGADDVGGARQRRLLAALVLHAGEVVSTDRLLDVVFGGAPPAGASTTIRSYVARLRKTLGDAQPGADQLISTEQGGYSLRVDAEMIDAAQFEASIQVARRQFSERGAVAAAATLRQGLAMWDGEAYGEFAFEDWAVPEVARLEELKTVAHEELNDVLLACGLAHDVVSATRGQVSEHPLRPRLRGQHMLALHRAGRQVEALRSLEEYQRILVDVGLEAPDELVRLGRAIASHDPALRLDSPAGQPLRGYRVGTALGEGAHGVVYRGVQPGVGREVAIKMIRAQLADDPDFIRRFDAEAQLAANLQHPHIVPIYDYWREPGGAYIVMRLLRDNLSARLATGPMDVAAVAEVAHQLGGALAAAHAAGVVHGDIKPSNVLIDESNAYLADFGVATIVESIAAAPSTYPSSGYEAPELLSGQPPSPASDQFALAVLLVHLLTGHLAFGTRAIATPYDRSPSIHVQRPGVPAPVDDVMWTATAWEPADRYPDIASFVDHFEAALAGRATPAPRLREAPNPYRGLRAFTEADQAVFFGREAIVDELVERLTRHGTEGRFVVAIGASGSGKSSVVRAGLLPKLRSGAVPGSEGWLIATMVPGSDPFGELDAALRSIASHDLTPRAAQPDEREVTRLLDAAVPPAQPLLLVIDQLEELFTQTSDESTRQNFLGGLLRGLDRPDGNLRVVATLRADFLDRPLRYSGFGQLVKLGTVAVVGMSAPKLASAVTRPAAGVGVEVDPALATQLVADVLDQPAGLPLLQFTLTELFDRRRGPVLGLEDYRALGGVDAAVAGRAETVFGQLSEAEREVAQRMFLRLVTVDESPSVSRRRALRSDLVSTANDHDAINTVIDAFGTSRLLTFDRHPESREPTVEIAHEALIGQWPRFDQWIAGAGEGLRIQGQLVDAADTWDQQGRDDGDLYRGLRLEGALEWADAQPGALSSLERAFLTASADMQAAQQEAERAQAERDRRTNRRLRGLLTGVGLLLAVALVAGALAIRQQRRADEEAAEARAAAAEADLATLISRSAAQSAENPEVAVLLALEAHRRLPARETEQAVLNALASRRIPNRISTFPGIDTSSCLSPALESEDGLRSYAHVDHRLVSMDLTTGRLSEHGSSDEACGAWLGDPVSGRTVASSEHLERTWVGTFEDPYAIELQQTGQMVLVNRDLTGNVAAFAAIGVPGVADEPVHLFNATTGEQIGGPIGEWEVRSAAVDGSGSFAAVSHANGRYAGDGGRVRVIDARTGQEIFDIATTSQASDFTFDPRTLELIAGMLNGDVMTVDLVTGEHSTVATTATDGVMEVGVRPDGLIVTMSARQVELVDRGTGPTGTATELRDILWGRVRDDGTIVKQGADRAWDVIKLDGNALIENSWPVDPRSRVAFYAGRAAVLNAADQQAAVIDLSTGERTELALRHPDGTHFTAEAVLPRPDGVWAIGGDGTIARWEGEMLVEGAGIDLPGQLLTGHGGAGRLAFLSSLVPADQNQLVAHLVSLDHGTAKVLFSVPAPEAISVHPSHDGGMHVFEHGGRLRSFDSNGELVREIETGTSFWGRQVVDLTSGVIAAATTFDGVVLIDPATASIETLPGPSSPRNLGFAQDGQLLVITDPDGSVRLWDLVSDESAGLVWDGTGSPDTLWASSWYDASSESVWLFSSGQLLEVPLDPKRWIERACEVVARNLTQEEWDRYVPGDETLQSACPPRT
jgi:serine/threonine protein kinase/DNA-binding SARP family transcriptional activator